MSLDITPGDGIVGELALLGDLIVGGFPEAVFTLPGVSVDEVLDHARLYLGFAEAAQTAQARVRALELPEFVGVEGEFFRGRVPGELGMQLGAAVESYSRVGSGIKELARELDASQVALKPLEARARAVFEHMQKVWIKVNVPFTEYSGLRSEWDDLVRAAGVVHERVAVAGQQAAAQINAGTEAMVPVNDYFSSLPGGAVAGGALAQGVRSTTSRAVSAAGGVTGAPGRAVKATANGLGAAAGAAVSVPQQITTRGQQLAPQVTPDGIKVGDQLLTDPTSEQAQKLVREGQATNILGLDPTGIPTAMMMLASPNTLIREQPRKKAAGRRWTADAGEPRNPGDRGGVVGQVVSVPGRFVGGAVDRAGNTIAGNAALIGVGGDPVRAWSGLAKNVTSPAAGVGRFAASATPEEILADPVAAAGSASTHAPVAVPFVGWAYGIVEALSKPGELAREGARESLEKSLDEATARNLEAGAAVANTGEVQVTTSDVDVHADNGGYITFTLPDLEGGEPKAWYIMATPDSPGHFTAQVPTGPDEELVERADGAVVLTNTRTGETVRTIKTPWAKDALGREQPTWYSIEKIDETTSTVTQHIQPNKGALYPLIADGPDNGNGADGKPITVQRLPNGQEIVHENGVDSVIGNPKPGEERAAAPAPRVAPSQTNTPQTSTADNGNGTTTVTTTDHSGKTSTRVAPTTEVDNALGQRAENERQRQQDINSRLRGPWHPAPAQDTTQAESRDTPSTSAPVDTSWRSVTNPNAVAHDLANTALHGSVAAPATSTSSGTSSGIEYGKPDAGQEAIDAANRINSWAVPAREKLQQEIAAKSAELQAVKDRPIDYSKGTISMPYPVNADPIPMDVAKKMADSQTLEQQLAALVQRYLSIPVVDVTKAITQILPNGSRSYTAPLIGADGKAASSTKGEAVQVEFGGARSGPTNNLVGNDGAYIRGTSVQTEHWADTGKITSRNIDPGSVQDLSFETSMTILDIVGIAAGVPEAGRIISGLTRGAASRIGTRLGEGAAVQDARAVTDLPKPDAAAAKVTTAGEPPVGTAPKTADTPHGTPAPPATTGPADRLGAGATAPTKPAAPTSPAPGPNYKPFTTSPAAEAAGAAAKVSDTPKITPTTAATPEKITTDAARTIDTPTTGDKTFTTMPTAEKAGGDAAKTAEGPSSTLGREVSHGSGTAQHDPVVSPPLDLKPRPIARTINKLDEAMAGYRAGSLSSSELGRIFHSISPNFGRRGADEVLQGLSRPRIGDANPAVPGGRIIQRPGAQPGVSHVSPDHVIPIAKMIEMKGFDQLTGRQVYDLLNWRGNLQWLDSAENGVKMSRSAGQMAGRWSSDFIRQQIALESRLRRQIPDIIEEMLRINKSAAKGG